MTVMTRRMPPVREGGWIVAVVVAAVIVALGIATSSKVSFYLDALEQSNLLYIVPPVAAGGVLALLLYPRLPLYAMAFLLPFNFVGGYWGSDLVAVLAKLTMNVLLFASLLPAFNTRAADRAWLTHTRLGVALLAWLAAIAMGIALGLLNAVNQEYWVRESGWMLFYAAAIPFGTLLRERRHLDQLLWAVCAGVAVLQVYAFWTLVTGTRYARTDAWEAGDSFFRAPYSVVSLFAMYLAAAAFLFGASARTLTRRTWMALFAAIALLGGGLLASMVRSMWICGAIGIAVVAWFAPWDRRTARAILAVASGVVLAVAVVAVIDRLSPSSTGDWTGSAVRFFMDLGSRESTSRVTREIEWAHAIDVWTRSPVVGQGFGYSFPQTDFVKVPIEVIPEPFYMHNSYLNILAKVGVFGLAAFLFLLWQALRGARDLARRADLASRDRIVAVAALAGLTSTAVLTTITPVLTAGDPAAYLGLLVGLVVTVRRVAPPQPQ